jgi:hydroxymethylpyrimidine/phosphomethylpyrimidine kinase
LTFDLQYRNASRQVQSVQRNSPPNTSPVALTIAGSDSGGGAGIQADLITFAALGVHGTSAITCLTAQNPKHVAGIQPCTPTLLRHQLEAVFAELKPAACKTGMLFSASLIRTVAGFVRGQPKLLLIADPVMVATSGARLLSGAGFRAFRDELLPLATLVTPNIDEAEVLAGGRIREPEDLRIAARSIVDQFGCAALVKGGHLAGVSEAMDLFYDGETELLLSTPFVRGISTHGTGCTYSAAITGYCALGHTLPDAVRLAKEYISQAIAHSQRVGRHYVLNWFWRRNVKSAPRSRS